MKFWGARPVPLRRSTGEILKINLKTGSKIVPGHLLMPRAGVAVGAAT